MPPLPKRKTSSARRDKRRAHDSLKARNLVPHRVCPNCGHYQGREVIEIKEE
jgi:large subunit ribosomal protein L32